MKQLGILLIVLGTIVGLHFLYDPIFHISTSETPFSPYWKYVDIVMMLIIAIGLVVSLLPSKKYPGTSACTPNNIYGIGFFVLLLLFTWNYAQIHNPSYLELGATEQVHSLVWVIIDVSAVTLSISLGKNLWCSKT